MKNLIVKHITDKYTTIATTSSIFLETEGEKVTCVSFWRYDSENNGPVREHIHYGKVYIMNENGKTVDWYILSN